jgi:hypothetical protein
LLCGATEEDGTLSIYLTKCNKMGWWKSVLKGEPQINTRKVVPENSRLDELDSETRSTAEKLMVWNIFAQTNQDCRSVFLAVCPNVVVDV